MQTLELQQLGLAPITQIEMQDVEGGGFSLWRAAPIAWLVDQVINNWDDLKAGIKEGYNAKL